MPDGRLQRTRDAYPDPWWITVQDVIAVLPPADDWTWVDTTATMVHAFAPVVFTVREPSDDDLWGV